MSAPNKKFTPALARKMFAYNPETGKLRYKQRPCTMFHTVVTRDVAASLRTCISWNKQFVGKRAGVLDASGTRRVRIGKYAKSTVKAANLIWYMVHNEWPPSYGPYSIIHVNGDNGDDRLANLMVQLTYMAQGGPVAFIDTYTDPAPTTPPPLAELRDLTQRYKTQRHRVAPKGFSQTQLYGHPAIVNRAERKQEGFRAIALLRRMARMYPPIVDTRRFQREIANWRRWLKANKFPPLSGRP
jgi:hypothetical protein